MLIEFQVRNFKSFRGTQTFSLVASPDPSLPDNVVMTDAVPDGRLLKSAVVYGANASGKTSLIEAIEFAQHFITEFRERKPTAQIPIPQFRLSTEGLPVSEFQFIFIQHDIRYQYGFTLDRERVRSEWLIAYPNKKGQKWFERDTGRDDPFSFGSHLKGEKRRIAELTRPNALFLSVAAQFNHEQLMIVYDWFKQLAVVTEFMGTNLWLERTTAELVRKDRKLHSQVAHLLKVADVGISDFVVEAEPYTEENTSHLQMLTEEQRAALVGTDRVEIKMRHALHDRAEAEVLFELWEESKGTRQFFGLAGSILGALRNQSVLIVDEMDSSLHPLLVRALVELFHKAATRSQLIFNTHDTTLLDRSLFRRDQVWFAEKDRTGASHLYSLWEFSPRKQEALQRGYLEGRYGALPVIGSVEESWLTDGKG